MTTTCLLPCTCGRKVPIEPRQAGGMIRCSCGASLEVPTLLEMASLERAQPELGPRRRARTWGIHEGLALVGTTVFLAALGLSGYLLTNQPPLPEREKKDIGPDAIRQQTQALTALESRRVWQFLRGTGPDGRTPVQKQIYDQTLGRYREMLLRWRLSMGVVVVIGVAGLGLVVIPLWKR